MTKSWFAECIIDSVGKLKSERMDIIERTKQYYEALDSLDLCQCDHCMNYVQEISRSYPQLAKFLSSMGVDPKKPFETMPLEVDENQIIEYLAAQYIIMGDSDDFNENVLGDVHISLASSHPSTGIDEAHFVMEVGPIILPWVL